MQRIAPILNRLADTLNLCETALQSDHPVSIDSLCEVLARTSQALRSVSPVIAELVKGEEDQGFALAGINDHALELLWSLDANSPHYAPRPPAENVALLRDLLEYLPGVEVAPDSNVVAVTFGGVKQ